MAAQYFRPTGSWVAMPTPYNADGSIDFGGFQTLIDRQIRYGTSELFVMGSAGENTLLTLDERRQIVPRIVKMTKGRIPVFFGFTLPSTDASVEFAKFCEAEGADGLIFTVPAYLLPPQAAVVEYFRACMGAVTIPVDVYSRTGSQLRPALRAGVGPGPGGSQRGEPLTASASVW